MKLNPLDSRVVVEPCKTDETSPGGIVIPNGVEQPVSYGKVISVGPGWVKEDGCRVKLTVAVGDKVVFNPGAGTEMELNSIKVRILRESDILATITE